MNQGTQRDITRNQSAFDVSHRHIFLFDNRYADTTFRNNTAGELTLEPGSLVLRDTGDATKVIPAITGATLADVIGIVSIESSIVLAAGEEANITYCFSGTVNKDYLVLPGADTLETLVGNKTVSDILQALGLDLQGSTEHTKFDN